MTVVVPVPEAAAAETAAAIELPLTKEVADGVVTTGNPLSAWS